MSQTIRVSADFTGTLIPLSAVVLSRDVSYRQFLACAFLAELAPALIQLPF